MEKSSRFVNSLSFQLEITAKIFRNLAENYFQQEVKNNITLEEYVVLDTLVCYPHIDKNTLAKTLDKDKATVEKTLARLEKKKLIKRSKKRTIRD